MGIDAGTPPGMWERVRAIAKEEVAKLLRSGLLRNASISGGGLTIKGGFLKVLFPESLGGALAVFFGDIINAVTGVYRGSGLLIQAPNGDDIAVFRTDVASGATVAELWRGTWPVVGTDPAGGLAYPFIGGGFAKARFEDWDVTTTSTGWETLFEQRIWKQQPRLEVALIATTNTADTAGETRVMVDGVQLGDVSVEQFQQAYRYFRGTVAGAHMATMKVEVQGRVTGGPGALYVEARHWVGRRSA